MAGKREKPEEIVSKLRQVEVLQGQGMTVAEAVHLGSTMLPHCFLEEFQCGFLVSGLGHEAFQDLAFVVYHSPEVGSFSVDLH
jgi:hypothetical protein